MKRSLLFTVFMALCFTAIAQTTPPPLPTSVPPQYATAHCFIKNPYKQTQYFGVSTDRVIWEEKKIKGYGTMDIEVVDSVFLRIKTSGNVVQQITALPSKYYKLKYNSKLKKWLIE